MSTEHELLSTTAELAERHLASLASRRVGPDAPALAALAALDRPLDDVGRDPSEVIAELAAVGGPATVASNGGRFFGFVNGSTLPAALAADWLVSAWDQNGALEVMSPVSARCEGTAIGWICDLLGLPASADGAFVTGATMANATCLAAARDHVLGGVGWDSVGQGLTGAPPIDVVVGDEAHSTIFKALGIIGLGRDNVRRLATDRQGAVVGRDLPPLASPAIVCLQAGNVNSGASDDFPRLVEWARDHGAWIHVDGAFGMWAAASPTRATQVLGVQTADSWATDGHKWLNLPYDSGLALVRDPSTLRASLGSQAAYLPDSGRDAMHMAPQSSQRARGVVAWAGLQSLGRDGVAELVDRCCDLATRFAARLAAGGLEILNEVVLNQVLVGFEDDATADNLAAAIQDDGRLWAGPTEWQGRRALRLSVSSWRTTEADIDASAGALLELLDGLRRT